MKVNWYFSAFLASMLFALVDAAVMKIETPSNDAFYSPAEGYESAKEGAILKYRKTPLRIRSLYVPLNVKSSWQLQIRSTDSFGNPIVIINTVIEPYNADPSKLVSYQAAEDSASTNCAPSYEILYGAPEFSTLEIQIEMMFLAPLLNQGYYVVTPDYEGSHAAFTAGRLAGHAVLDSIRGTLNSGNVTGLRSDSNVTLWGYSGGSLATGWAAALQPTYAPELAPRLLGAACGGWVTNITATVTVVEGTLFAGLTVSGINGLLNEYGSEFPEFAKLVNEQLVPDKNSSFYEAGQQCLVPSIVSHVYDTIFTGPNRYFKDGYELLQNDIVKEVIYNNTIAVKKNDEIPDIPLFVYHGEKDMIVPFKDSQRAYDNWCDWGIESFEFAVSESTGHISEFVEGAPAALKWIINRFDGEPTVKGCQRTVRPTNLLYPGALTSVFDLVDTTITEIVGGPLGPNGENITTENFNKFYDTK